jgi:hypothetical protein
MTLDELDYKLPDGFDGRKSDSIEVDDAAGRATLNVALLTGWAEDPEPDRERYQNRVLTMRGEGRLDRSKTKTFTVLRKVLTAPGDDRCSLDWSARAC